MFRWTTTVRNDKVRGPAVARKNFYGSGSLWSGRLAAIMFSIVATLLHWKINPRLWLTWYLESCAAAGGKAPEDIQPFLPWNLSDERRAELGAPHRPSGQQHLLTPARRPRRFTADLRTLPLFAFPYRSGFAPRRIPAPTG